MPVTAQQCMAQALSPSDRIPGGASHAEREYNAARRLCFSSVFVAMMFAVVREFFFDQGSHMVEAMRKVEVLRAACCVAGVDGHTTDTERKVLQRLAGEIGVGYASLSAMIEQAETDKGFYNEQFRVLKSEPKDTMQLLFRIAVVDEKFSHEEALVLKRLSQRLNIPPKIFDRWLQQTIGYLKKKKSLANGSFP